MVKKVNKHRGRPKGSKNKATILKEREALNKGKKEVLAPLHPARKFKHIGYCRCGNMVGDVDLVSKFIYVCSHCKNRGKVSQLGKESKGEKHSTKRDYLEDVTESNHLASVPLNDDLDPNAFKIIEK
jgi:hypothetical protein